MLLVLYLSLEYLYAVGSQYTFYGSLNKLHQNTFSFSFQNQFFLYGGKTGGTQVRIALELAINSFHNFGFRERHLTEAFQCHISIDGIVEFMTGYQNTFLGIMWHPERYKIFDDHDITLFKTFFGEKI